MLKIQKKITEVNRTKLENKRNMWIIIHYVGAVSTAKANAQYFYSADRQASANYFVDENEIWQVVEDSDAAWHIGAKKYYNSARNTNSIGIEMCCKKDSKGNFYFEPETVTRTIELTRYLMEKYNIPIERIARHYDCTGKLCPKPWVENEKEWRDFLFRVKETKIDMFVDEEKALDFLVEKQRITNKEYWQKALSVTKNLNFLIIKWANDVRELEMKNGLI